MPAHFLVQQFVAGKVDLGGIDNDYKISGINMGGINRLVFPS